MQGWLVWCQLRTKFFLYIKIFVPQTVVWYKFFVNFFLGKKTRVGKNNCGKNKDCVGLLPFQGGRWGMDFRVSKEQKEKKEKRKTNSFQLKTLFSNIFWQQRGWYIGGNSANQTWTSASVNARSSRNVPHTPCKLQRWSSALNASSSRNVFIIRIIIHWFRHTGCLRALIRAVATASLCVESNRLIPIKNGWFFNIWNFFAANFEFWSQKSIFSIKKPACCMLRKVGGGSKLTWLMGYFLACMSKK